jgi:hypothetical protein
MNTSDKILMWISIVLVVIALLLFGVRVVFAEDWGGCTDPRAVNYSIAIPDMEDAGYRVVDDGSCYYLKIEDGVGTDGTKDDNNYFEWLDEVYSPAYYGKLIDIGGCTDPAAINWMDPQWWPDYNVIDDGSCIYPEPVVYPEPENAL